MIGKPKQRHNSNSKTGQNNESKQKHGRELKHMQRVANLFFSLSHHQVRIVRQRTSEMTTASAAATAATATAGVRIVMMMVMVMRRRRRRVMMVIEMEEMMPMRRVGWKSVSAAVMWHTVTTERWRSPVKNRRRKGLERAVVAHRRVLVACHALPQRHAHRDRDAADAARCVCVQQRRLERLAAVRAQRRAADGSLSSPVPRRRHVLRVSWEVRDRSQAWWRGEHEARPRPLKQGRDPSERHRVVSGAPSGKLESTGAPCHKEQQPVELGLADVGELEASEGVDLLRGWLRCVLNDFCALLHRSEALLENRGVELDVGLMVFAVCVEADGDDVWIACDGWRVRCHELEGESKSIGFRCDAYDLCVFLHNRLKKVFLIFERIEAQRKTSDL